MSVPGVGTFVKLKSLIELKPEETLQVHRESFGLPVIKRPQAKLAAESSVSTEPNEPVAIETPPLASKKTSTNTQSANRLKAALQTLVCFSYGQLRSCRSQHALCVFYRIHLIF